MIRLNFQHGNNSSLLSHWVGEGTEPRLTRHLISSHQSLQRRGPFINCGIPTTRTMKNETFHFQLDRCIMSLRLALHDSLILSQNNSDRHFLRRSLLFWGDFFTATHSFFPLNWFSGLFGSLERTSFPPPAPESLNDYRSMRIKFWILFRPLPLWSR